MPTGYELAAARESPRLCDVLIRPAALARFAAATAAVPTDACRRVAVLDGLRDALRDALAPDGGAAIRAAVADRARGALRVALAPTLGDPDEWMRFVVGLGRLLGRPTLKPAAGTAVDRGLLLGTKGDRGRAYVPPPFLPDPLHNDGNRWSGRFDDYAILLVAERAHCAGGATRLLHLDDWADADAFTRSPLARRPFPYAGWKDSDGPVDRATALDPALAADLRVHDTALFFDAAGGVCSRVSPGHMHPPDPDHWAYVCAARDSLERSAGCVEFLLRPGEMWVTHNGFWLHGRTAIDPHPDLRRVYYRVKGTFDAA